ncbi:MAG: hypothetical protein IJU16_03455 [Clostridia bacterium]|nr:hypothetical protein [Clostridia bacterium]
MEFDVILIPTEEELLNGLQRAQLRRASTPRLIVQTVLLAAVAAWSGIAFFGDGMNSLPSLLIAIVALALIPVMWLAPGARLKAMAKDAAGSGEHPHMWVWDDGVDFGPERPDTAYYMFGAFFVDQNEQSLVFRFASDEVIVVPCRQLTDDQRRFLFEKTAGSTAIRRTRWR